MKNCVNINVLVVKNLLKEEDDVIVQSCQEHFYKLFARHDNKNPYFHYCNNCEGQVCESCSKEKRIGKSRTCDYCKHELIKKYF